ncbi:serine hydrolase [Luteimonas salinilitoris]|uniref:Serine hydrolase n=1 Tax=Luteimonas salinilitoris TaxID=3237697 RepID=A0ABV4HZK5_9GAMM
MKPLPLRPGRWAVMLAAGLGSHAFAASPPADLDMQLDAIFGQNISATTPGCVLGVRQGEFELQRAWGQADLERGVALTPDSVLIIGSVAKQFTAMAVLLLADDGKLALDDDVHRFLPELPERDPPITIDHLLSHTSGLRDFRATDWLLGRDVLPLTNDDVLAYAARQRELNHAPGASHLYTNTGYALLALIVERASGQSFAAFTRERLFVSADMRHTQWEDDPRQLVAGRAIGYAQAEPAGDGAPAGFVQMPSARRTTGHGGALTTAGDMLRWNAALSRDAFGSGLTAQLEQRARLRNGHTLDYARGVFVGEYRGLREVQHSGYTGTYTTWVGRYPEADLSIALLCNGDADEVDPHAIADLFLAESKRSSEAAQDTPATRADLSARSGVYRNMQTGDLAMLDFPHEVRLTNGRYVRGPVAYAFDPDRIGRIVQHLYGIASTWERLPAATPAAESLGEYAGRYDSDALLGGYDVRLDGQQLAMSVHGLSSIVVPLQPLARDVFLAQGIQMPVEFRRDGTGRIIALTLSPSLLRGLTFERLAGEK